MTSCIWPALGADANNVRLAGLLRRAHAITLDTGVVPRMVRDVISESWRRSVAAGVDPRRPAPRILDVHKTAERLAEHPVAKVLPRVSELLGDTMTDSGYFAAFSDAEGVLLWSDGPGRALESAVAPRFLPGFLCSEERIGTNAIGTALVLDHPVQVFSAEHFNQLLHGWSCAAAPIHDPDTGRLLGALDLSGQFRTAHAHSLGLVAAVARATEGWLAADYRREEAQLVELYRGRRRGGQQGPTAVISASGRVLHAEPAGWLGARVDVMPDAGDWPRADGTAICAEPLQTGFLVWRDGSRRGHGTGTRMTVAVLGRNQAALKVDGRLLRLRSRHSEIIALLSLNPGGMTVRDLSLALYGTSSRHATVRAEMSRLRPLIGANLCSRPYRLSRRVQVDAATVERQVAMGKLAAARRRYAGPLLPESQAPGIVAARDRLARALSVPA